MTIEKVEAWKATDGTVHATLETAQKHDFLRMLTSINEDIEGVIAEMLWRNRLRLFDHLAKMYAKPKDMTIAGTK